MYIQIRKGSAGMELPDLHNRIKALMDSRGINGAMLADATGLPTATISRYINAMRSPKIENLILIADYFGVSLDYLLCRQSSEQICLDARTSEMVSRYMVASKRDKEAVDIILSAYEGKS